MYLYANGDENLSVYGNHWIYEIMIFFENIRNT